MSKGDRKSKVTSEHKAEAHRLSAIWESRPHPSQAEFAETFDIGNQSAVSQFLQGKVALSLKAARGFAKGLGCRIEDFSPRLAAEAAAIATMVPGGGLLPEIAALAAEINSMPELQRDFVLNAARSSIKVSEAALQLKENRVSGTQDVGEQERRSSPKRARRG